MPRKGITMMSTRAKRASRKRTTGKAAKEPLQFSYDHDDAQRYGNRAVSEVGKLSAERAAQLTFDDGLDAILWDGFSERDKEIALFYYRMGFENGFLATAKKAQAGRAAGRRNANNKKAAAAMKRDAAIRSFYESAAGSDRERMRATRDKFPTVKRSTIYAALNRGV